MAPWGSTPKWSRTTVLFTFDDDVVAAATTPEELTSALLAEGMVPGCSPVGWSGFGDDQYAQSVAVGWILGRLQPLPGTPATVRDEVEAKSRPVWEKLKALPWSGQLARINAMRGAALACKGDPFEAVSGRGAG